MEALRLHLKNSNRAPDAPRRWYEKNDEELELSDCRPKEFAGDGSASPADPGRPPKEHRLQEGGPEDARDQTKASKSRKDIARKVLLELHDTLENGVRVERSTLECIVLTLRNLACSGDVKALKVFDKLGEHLLTEDSGARGGTLVVPPRLTVEEWEIQARMYTLDDVLGKSR